MGRTIGVWAAEHVAVGLVESNQVVGPPGVYPEVGTEADPLKGMPAEMIVQCIREEVLKMAASPADHDSIQAIGVGFPGMISNGVIIDSPNLAQVKGFDLQSALREALGRSGLAAPVLVLNDADAMAAGIAAAHGHLDKFIRVWTLGNGVGFGRFPWLDGAWEGGHSVVTLDAKERFCGCGGEGHLEGIVGHRSMRLRFLDKEPEEVFEDARAGDGRCAEFVKLWHRALAAGTATSIHMDGAGKFFLCGPNARFVELGLLSMYVQDMVKMSPLQGSFFEVVRASDTLGITGAALTAERAQRRT